MMCILLSEDNSVSKIDHILVSIINKARSAKQSSIGIIFFSNSVSKVFRYREAFTKYIDIGVKIYIENNVETIKRIILDNCDSIYTLADDGTVHKFFEAMTVDMTIYRI